MRLIEADGSLGREMHFSYKRSHAYIVGQVYSCEFSESGETVYGLDRAKWLRRWEDEQARIEWHTKERQAETAVKRAKLEADAGRVSDIEQALRPLRELYSSMRARYDMDGCRALEEAVLSALRTPVRKAE